jgi:hypothetical protein
MPDELQARLNGLHDSAPQAEARRVESLIHHIAALPGLKLEAQLRVLTESPLEPQHRQRLARALNNLASRINVLIDMIEEKKPA